MLSERYSMEELAELLPAYGLWQPYPTVMERGAWEGLLAAVREAYLEYGEAAEGYEWPALPATLFLEYARVGNRSRYQSVRYARRHALRDLVIAECVEGRGRFLDDIVNGVWITCEETYWGVPAHISMQRAGVDLPDAEEPTVDLFAAETAALLAWADYLLGEQLNDVSPLVRPRIRYEVQRRVLDPCLARDDFWWMSFDPGVHSINNWNPWINSNWLTAVLLLEPGPERRVKAVDKILRSLDIFLGTYASSGGCDEGPGYWGRAAASLFDCLELLYSATDGEFDVYDEPKIQNMGRFIYRTHIHNHYFVNFADASAINHPSAALVFRYGQRIADQDMMAFGAWLAAQQDLTTHGPRESLGRQLPALFALDELLDTAPAQPLPRDAWFHGIQVMVARDSGGTHEGLFVAAKGGHNNESHNHNDVGNFIVYVDGRPVVVDAGVETYRRQTFSPQRYEIWTMQSAYHTLLPTVDGVMQAPGKEFAAQDVDYEVDDTQATLKLDLAPAYPEEVGLVSWQRAVTLGRGKAVVVTDVYELDAPAEEIVFGFLTPCEVVETAAGELLLKERAFGEGRLSGEATFHYPSSMTVEVKAVAIEDERLGGVWGESLTHVVFKAQTPEQEGTWVWRVS